MTRCGGSFCYPSPQGTEAGGLAGDLSQVQAQPGMHSKFQPKLHSKTMSEKQTKQNKNPKKATVVTQPPQAKVEEFPRHIKKKKSIKNVPLCLLRGECMKHRDSGHHVMVNYWGSREGHTVLT